MTMTCDYGHDNSMKKNKPLLYAKAVMVIVNGHGQRATSQLIMLINFEQLLINTLQQNY